MSWQTVRAVFESSSSRGAARLVLLAIADRADEQGRGAFLSGAQLQEAAKVDARTVRRALRELEDLGELAVVGQARNGANVFAITLATSAPSSVFEAPRRPVKMLGTCGKPVEKSKTRSGNMPEGGGRHARGGRALRPGGEGVAPSLTKQSENDPEISGNQDPRKGPRPGGRDFGSTCGKLRSPGPWTLDPPNAKLLGALARAVIRERPAYWFGAGAADLAEEIKTRAGRARIAYDGATVGQAIDAAGIILKRERSA